ncbi:F-box/WD-40 repeat-containing protein At5g21040 [Cicer arietinum]|uniref:F-box/WD-40 repeat-containing protein At5g21040 n=1 Tax=Cicer arietinum TaxID=3827 RepID=A0A1S2XMY4_CICAR|nr:F-box/WD-40 repeat-containing protein At5g21040 [Cicer arietinum]
MAFEFPQSTKVSHNLVENPSIHIDIDIVKSNQEPNSKLESIKRDNFKGKSKLSSKKGIKASATDLNQSSVPGDVVIASRRSITDLPPVLISEILNCLDPKDLGIVSCVSTILHSLASEHHAWKQFYCDRWGLPTAPAALDPGDGVADSDEKSWKEIFVEREFRSKTFMGRYSMEVLYGHTEAVRTVFLLASAKLLFTSGYDTVVRMWNMEDGLSIASSKPLGCTIRAVAADTRLLVAGGTDGFIHCWRAVEGMPHLFDLRGSPQNQNTEVRLWGHDGPVTSLAFDLTRIYSGSWDTTVRVWDRHSMKCMVVLRHSDWVWGLVPHDTTVASTSGSDVYVWDTNSGSLVTIVQNAHVGNTYALARSLTGDFVFTGGEDGSIHMYEIVHDSYVTEALHVATWDPHSGPVYSLAFEFPWLVSSSDGKLALIDVRKLLRTSKRSLGKRATKAKHSGEVNVEPPQRMLHGFKSNLYSVDIGADRIVCGGEEGVVRIWNFTEALETERRVRALRGLRLENRMRRRKLQTDYNSKGGRSDQCSVVAKKNSVTCIWPSKRGMSGKTKA